MIKALVAGSSPRATLQCRVKPPRDDLYAVQGQAPARRFICSAGSAPPRDALVAVQGQAPRATLQFRGSAPARRFICRVNPPRDDSYAGSIPARRVSCSAGSAPPRDDLYAVQGQAPARRFICSAGSSPRATIYMQCRVKPPRDDSYAGSSPRATLQCRVSAPRDVLVAVQGRVPARRVNNL